MFASDCLRLQERKNPCVGLDAARPSCCLEHIGFEMRCRALSAPSKAELQAAEEQPGVLRPAAPDWRGWRLRHLFRGSANSAITLRRRRRHSRATAAIWASCHAKDRFYRQMVTEDPALL